MIQFRKSIGFRLLGISFILLALPLLVDSFILVQRRYQHAISDAKEILIEIAHLRELPLTQLQPLNKPLLELLNNYLDLTTHFPQSHQPELDQKLKKLAEVGEFYAIFLLKITDDNRYIVVSSSREEYLGQDYTNFFKLQNLYAPESLEKGYVAYLFFDHKTNHAFMMIAEPLFSKNENHFVGVLALTQDISAKLEGLLTPEKRHYEVNFALLLPSSIVFDASDPALKFQYFLPLKADYKRLFLEEEPSAQKKLPDNPLPVSNAIGYPFFEFNWKNEQQIGYIKKLPGSNNSLLTYTSKNAIYQRPLIDFFHIYSTYGIILVVGGTLATLITMRMAKPIQNLSLVMQKIQEGSLNYRYRKDPLGFEINTLGAIFNEMVDAVLGQKRKAEEERIKREIFASELKLGSQVQQSLLPQKMPHYPGVDMAQIYIPAIEVGGDFYDSFVKEKDHQKELFLAVADASGKGVHACLYSLSLRTMLAIYVREYRDIAQAMVATNNLFMQDTGDSGMFVTVLAGIYNYKNKILNYYSCGHNPGLVHRRNGDIEVLEHKGIAMGVREFEKAEAATVQLQQGDTLVFYSDGITEARNEEYKFFGEERLIDCLKLEGNKSALEIVEKIVAQVNIFVGSAPQHDDITLLVMKITE